MSLKTGNWKFNENGSETLFQIDNVDPVSGEVSGQMDSGIARLQPHCRSRFLGGRESPAALHEQGIVFRGRRLCRVRA